MYRHTPLQMWFLSFTEVTTYGRQGMSNYQQLEYLFKTMFKLKNDIIKIMHHQKFMQGFASDAREYGTAINHFVQNT